MLLHGDTKGSRHGIRASSSCWGPEFAPAFFNYHECAPFSRRPPPPPLPPPTPHLTPNRQVSTRGSVEATSLDVDKRVMTVNYFGAVGLTKGLLETRPLMTPMAESRSRKAGAAETRGSTGTAPAVHFVVINSVQGKFGLAFRSSYAASKHALVGFFDCLRAEQAHRGVRVLSVFPGYVRTRLVAGSIFCLCFFIHCSRYSLSSGVCVACFLGVHSRASSAKLFGTLYSRTRGGLVLVSFVDTQPRCPAP